MVRAARAAAAQPGAAGPRRGVREGAAGGNVRANGIPNVFKVTNDLQAKQ